MVTMHDSAMLADSSPLDSLVEVSLTRSAAPPRPSRMDMSGWYFMRMRRAMRRRVTRRAWAWCEMSSGRESPMASICNCITSSMLSTTLIFSLTRMTLSLASCI